MCLSGGTDIEWLATKDKGNPVRRAALNKISLITAGHASASTHICMLCSRKRYIYLGKHTTIYYYCRAGRVA